MKVFAGQVESNEDDPRNRKPFEGGHRYLHYVTYVDALWPLNLVK